MSSEFLSTLSVAASAAIASLMGVLLVLWRRPTTLFMSLALGFVSGVLLATISFEMLPADLELSSLSLAVAGFLVGFAAVYELDLFINWAKLLRIVVVDINDKQLTTLEQA